MSRASWWRRLWRAAVSTPLLAGAMQAAQDGARLECVLTGDPDARVYRLVDRGSSSSPRWWLTMTSRLLATRQVELPLAEAQVDLTRPGSISLVNKSLNGGLTVVLQPESSAYRLDVFVNFELEVNVWRDLSPDVELMNTEGPRLDATCRGLSSPKSLS